MKILIDDMRNKLPDGSEPDIIIRDGMAAITFVSGWIFNNNHDTLYVDHDLGGKYTGYDVLVFIEQLQELGLEGKSEFYCLPYDIFCVSDNPPGRARIEQVIQKLYGG